MKKTAAFLFALGLCIPSVASTHKFNYNMPCASLWPAVKDTIRNSGKYGIIGIDNGEMTVSYSIGGNLTGKRINSLLLNTIPTGCELQVQTRASGLLNNDVGDLKKRVDESLVKLQSATPATPAPATAPAPAAAAQPASPTAPATAPVPSEPAKPATPGKN